MKKEEARRESSCTSRGADFYRNSEIAFKAIQPLLIKTGFTIQEEIDHFYEQMLFEMRTANFYGFWFFLTSWGTKP